MTGINVFVIAALIGITGPALAETLRCTESFQHYEVCDDGHGYRSTEWQWQGFTIGDDNAGNRWTTLHGRDIDITTVTPRPER